MPSLDNPDKGAPLQAIFLDRDGVINRERSDYVKNWDEIELLPNVLVALQRLAQLPIPIAVLTNQSAIARGLVSAAQVDAIHQRLARLVAAHGGRIDAFFVCPHHPNDGCMCRKPKPGLLYRAAQHFQVDVTQSLFVGDALSDYQAACAAHCHALLVRSGRQGAELPNLVPDQMKTLLLPDLAAAVDEIAGSFPFDSYATIDRATNYSTDE
jgi:D-glycero-D-manno-heptose 1,7-bisphosphate phosphatase